MTRCRAQERGEFPVLSKASTGPARGSHWSEDRRLWEEGWGQAIVLDALRVAAAGQRLTVHRQGMEVAGRARPGGPSRVSWIQSGAKGGATYPASPVVEEAPTGIEPV